MTSQGDDNSHATEVRERWSRPENVSALAAIRDALTGAGDWRALVRDGTQPWGAETDLAGIPLEGAVLAGRDLTGVHLSYADLRACGLRGVLRP
ncbi:pentapeptide repeat-containing protein [Streptomyces sp. NPDC006274]|uniref:pentapeptide repeat-containing protein n=1 Tax=unclassified Streptomyces TaxID=2593676 RepID=UPI0033A8B021